MFMACLVAPAAVIAQSLPDGSPCMFNRDCLSGKCRGGAHKCRTSAPARWRGVPEERAMLVGRAAAARTRSARATDPSDVRAVRGRPTVADASRRPRAARFATSGVTAGAIVDASTIAHPRPKVSYRFA
jgi:hypothetical protein